MLTASDLDLLGAIGSRDDIAQVVLIRVFSLCGLVQNNHSADHNKSIWCCFFVEYLCARINSVSYHPMFCLPCAVTARLSICILLQCSECLFVHVLV